MSDVTSDEVDPLAEYGPEQIRRTISAPSRNKVPTVRHIAYEMSDDPGHTYTCKPASSSKYPDETEEQWLERSKFKYVPADAVNVRIASD